MRPYSSLMLREMASYLGGSRGQHVYGLMKDFPSCFGESGVQVADSSPSTATRAPAAAPPQNIVVCVYHYHSQAFSGFITVTWIKNLMAQALSVAVEDSRSDCVGKVDIRPWLFSKRKGFKNMVVDSTSVDIYWDLSSARFGSGPEPLEGFYLAIAINQELCLLAGDMQSEAYKKVDPAPFASKATLVARKEQIFGKRVYNCKAQLSGKGRVHEIRIEYEASEKCLRMMIDRKAVLEVGRLKWKFRGNHTIVVDGDSVEVYWDVHRWVFESVVGSATFLFRTGESSAAAEDCWDKFKDSSDVSSQSESLGFSLVLCAWKNE